MDRRHLLAIATGAAAAAWACERKVDQTAEPRPAVPDPNQPGAGARRMPSIFVAHGAPMVSDDPEWMGLWAKWAAVLPKPTAILMVSAHWEQSPIAIGATRTVPLVYDFYGFPKKYYEITYPAPGAPQLALRLQALLTGGGPIAAMPNRGLDHGAYVPLLGMYPQADVPVLQLSIPTLEPADLLALGRKLAPLRDEGVLIVGSGFLTHNLRAFDPGPGAKTMAWAQEFDHWCQEALSARDFDRLARYRQEAPGVRLALPTHEHFVPLFVAAGAAAEPADGVSYPITGLMWGSLSRRSVQFG